MDTTISHNRLTELTLLLLQRLYVKNLLWRLDCKATAAEKKAFSDFERAYQTEGRFVSKGRFCSTIRVVFDNRYYYVKRYRARGILKGFGRSKPVAEYHNYTYLERLGIPVPRIVGYGRVRFLGLFLQGAIITEEVPQAVDLQTLFSTRPDLWRNRSWLTQVLRLIADYTRRIHEDGFAHGDLKYRNILATTTEMPRVFFIDCPNGSRKSLLRRGHFIVKDLAGLDNVMAQHLSRTTRLRLFLWYRNRTHLKRGDKTLIARVRAFGG